MKNDLIIREPELYFDSIHQELNNFLRDTFLTNAFANPLNIKKTSIWRPAIEVRQNDKNYKVKVQLPGVKKDEEAKNERCHTSEFRYGKYQRTISFDAPIRADEAEAEYKNGLLIITIPKQKTETTTKKKLEIREK